jgi:DNA-binding IclR family transcriptional regulator
MATEHALSGADRVLAALKVLAERPKGVRLSELGAELGAPKSTTHRVLATLRRSELAEQDAEGRYHLSPQFTRLAFRHYEALGDWNIVQGVLDALVRRFRETSYYARLEGASVVYQAMARSQGQLHTASVVGDRADAWSTSLGKALLAATLPDRSSVERFVEEHGPLRSHTPNTLTTAAALHAELAATRRRGYSVDNEENEPGVVCIGFPVHLRPSDRPTGAISVAAIKARTSLETLLDRVGEASATIEQHLGIGSIARPGSDAGP